MKSVWRSPTIGSALLIALAACSNSDGDSEAAADDGTKTPGTGVDSPDGNQSVDGNGNACVSTRDFLATRAWPTLSTKCLSCHGPGGVADRQNADFKLLPAAYPGFLEENLKNIGEVSKTENEGTSIMLRKPLGELKHGGAEIFAADSEEYQLMEELVDRVGATDDCPEVAGVAQFSDVELLDSLQTFRKVTLQLNGRLPNAAEVASLLESGDESLPALVRNLLEEDAFYERLIEIFNDQWLTDRYLRDGQNVLDDEDFPNIDAYYDSLSRDQQEAARRSVAREPLQLMAYIVRNDRPFTEILTADYTVMNSYTAQVYNNEGMTFSGEYDESEVKEGKIQIIRDGKKIAFPHAGILSSPMFLNRYPTSRTNRNRHRARIVLREFLATDILKIADRPIDPTTAVKFTNPTREDPSCSTCHAMLDPIAGAFQKWNDNDQEQYEPDREWHAEMFPPGFATDTMKADEASDALAWLGKRVADDPRFPLSVVRNIYKSLVGVAPLEFPDDPLDGTYPAWEAQDATIRAIAEAFVAGDYNLKIVVEQIVLSAYYRATNTTATDEGRLAQLAAVGTGQLLTPELLQRKILATTGIEWRYRDQPALLNDYRILFGGIDSNTVTERLVAPNGIMSAIAWRMANEVSCRATAYDFAKSPDDRWLYPKVEIDTVPENELAEADAKGEQAIRENIQYLYALLLGERMELDGAELDRAYDLFLSAWREGRAGLASETVERSLPGECQFRRDPFTNNEVPEATRLTRDENYVIRSWMAVTSYLLSDFRFLYE